jgi:structure-specific recognition protein 1
MLKVFFSEDFKVCGSDSGSPSDSDSDSSGAKTASDATSSGDIAMTRDARKVKTTTKESKGKRKDASSEDKAKKPAKN